LHKLILVTHKFKIEDWRRKVATLLGTFNEWDWNSSWIDSKVKAIQL